MKTHVALCCQQLFIESTTAKRACQSVPMHFDRTHFAAGLCCFASFAMVRSIVSVSSCLGLLPGALAACCSTSEVIRASRVKK